MLNRELYNSYTPIKKGCHPLLSGEHAFSERAFFFNHRLWVWLWAQNKFTYCECHTSSFGYWTEKLKWIIKCWDNTLIIPRIRFACWKGKGVTDSLMTTQSVAPSVWQYPFTSLGEREQSHKFSWLWMLSPRERWVESQPRGTFPMLKVLHFWEHCFPGNNTFTHRAPLDSGELWGVYLTHRGRLCSALLCDIPTQHEWSTSQLFSAKR